MSYADFITLLFAFFVVMFATSQTDNVKAQQVSDSVKKALAGQPLATMVSAILGPGPVVKLHPAMHDDPRSAKPGASGDEHLSELLPSLVILTRELKEEIKSGRMVLSMGPRGLTVSFRQAALFPSGEDVIALDAYSSIEKVAVVLKGIPNPARLRIYRCGSHSQLPLQEQLGAVGRAQHRASGTADEALRRSRSQLSIAGYADTAPVSDNDSVEGRARNRRVDIVILNNNGLKGEPSRLEK